MDMVSQYVTQNFMKKRTFFIIAAILIVAVLITIAVELRTRYIIADIITDEAMEDMQPYEGLDPMDSLINRNSGK